MSKQLITLCFISVSFFCYSQKSIKPFVGLNFSGRILSSDNTHRKDSLNESDKMKVFGAAGVQFLFEKYQGREFYCGINYLENGFERERLDYKFLDSVYDLGKIFDQSQAAQKNGYFTYHFKYLELPIGMNYQVTSRRSMNIYTGWFNVGLVPQILLKQNLTIFLQGFTMKGKDHFNQNNTGYKASPINCAFQTGGRFDVNIKNKFWVTTDALLRMQIFNTASNAYEKLWVWHFSVNLGIKYEIGHFR